MIGELAAAFTTGLLGGLGHCLAMCGPLVGGLALAAAGPAGTARALQGQLAYHAGRVTTYALLGAIMGLTGAFVDVAGRLAGVKAVAGVLAGALMIASGLGAMGLAAPLRRLEARAAGGVARAARGLLEGGTAGRLFPVGLVLGVMPCGLSWTMFLGAAATGHPGRGLALTLAFALGTVPALLLAGTAGTLLAGRARGWLARAGGAVVVALGASYLLRGLGVHGP
ncbi:MAG: sulfite exporter TauE/SafE family protein [Anaeromyxobacter sp.]